MADSQAHIVLCAAGMEMPELAGVARADIGNVEEWGAKGQKEENPPARNDSQRGLVYIMYTSGSTGEPKGVMVAQNGVKRLVLNNGYAEFRAGQRVAFASNPAFDAATLEIWGPLLNGGCVVAIEQSVLLDPGQFGTALMREKVDILWLT